MPKRKVVSLKNISKEKVSDAVNLVTNIGKTAAQEGKCCAVIAFEEVLQGSIDCAAKNLNSTNEKV